MVFRRRPARRGSGALTAFRIADGRFKPFDATGALLLGGRWNSPGVRVICACASHAGALLERLVHAGIGRIPRHQVMVVITVPAGVPVEHRAAEELPAGWDSPDLRASREFGDAWARSGRSAVLTVPSVVARRECNVLINPAHPRFRSITVSDAEPVIWDRRLFERGS